MLVDLKVSNFAIIENIHISFKEGLNVLSGETGAGKSVLLKSLALLTGDKASPDMIRTGANQASIEGVFDISSRDDIKAKLFMMMIEVDDLLVVRRVLTGKTSRIYMNDTVVSAGALKDVLSPGVDIGDESDPLVEITGQHANRILQSLRHQLDIVDHFSGSLPKRLVFRDKFLRLTTIIREIQNIESSRKEKAQRLDYLSYQRDEIEKVAPQVGEDLSLEEEIRKLRNFSKAQEAISSVDRSLSGSGSISDLLSAAGKKLSSLSSFDLKFEKMAEKLRSAKDISDEVSFELSQYSSGMETDPGRLPAAEERLSQIRKIQNKHGPSIEEVLHYLKAITEEISGIENGHEKIRELQKEQSQIAKELAALGSEISQQRKDGVKRLSDLVNSELLELNMKGVIFHISVSPSEMSSTGVDVIEFLIQTSAKDKPRPLAKFASGGELSRILLSIKRSVGRGDSPKTYLFDEVDTGVSGETAEKVGRKLREISIGQQVICITHLPQVAMFADTHFFIKKSPQSGQASMIVSELNNEERKIELARLVSGEKITKSSLEHAEQLLIQANKKPTEKGKNEFQGSENRKCPKG